jgi:hypothetical protein
MNKEEKAEQKAAEKSINTLVKIARQKGALISDEIITTKNDTIQQIPLSFSSETTK